MASFFPCGSMKADGLRMPFTVISLNLTAKQALARIIHELSPILRKFLKSRQMCHVAQEHSFGERGP